MRVWWLSPVKLIPGRQGRGGSGYVTEGGRRPGGSRRTVLTPWPPGADPGGCQVSGGRHGNLEAPRLSLISNKNGSFSWHSVWPLCSWNDRHISWFSQTLSVNSWQHTGGDMEKLGGQEKGICQGAPSRRLTHNMAGGEWARGEGSWPLSHWTQPDPGPRGREKCN